MSTTQKDECSVAAEQNVKTLTKRATHFIAKIKKLATGFYLDKTIDLSFVLCCIVLLVQVVLIATGVLQ